MPDARELLQRGLKSLGSMGGVPMERDTLIHALGIKWSESPPRSDCENTISELERLGLVVGASDPVTGVAYTLTTKGELALKKLLR